MRHPTFPCLPGCVGAVSGRWTTCVAEALRPPTPPTQTSTHQIMPPSYPSKRVVTSLQGSVMTLRFNNPKRFNAWCPVMLGEMQETMRLANGDEGVRGLIITGTDDYYCSGVDFGGSMKAMRPSSMRKKIERENAAVFESYLGFTKPLVAAVNGPAIGASVTSAVLCDAIVASPTATFHTPFAALGITAEGCSSFTFPEKFGEAAAARLLGEEGWKPTAAEALEIGLVESVHEQEKLLGAAQARVEDMVGAGVARRVVSDPAYLEKLREVNAAESEALGHAFMSTAFLRGQEEFFTKRKKDKLASTFKYLRWTRPLWIHI